MSRLVVTWLALAVLTSTHAGAQALEAKGGKLYYCNKPIRLVGYGDYGMVTESSFDYEQYIDTLTRSGLNFCRIWVIYHWTHDLMPWAGSWKKWQLSAYDPAFWARLKDFTAYAEKRGVIVQVNIFDTSGLDPGNPLRWPNNAYNNANNTDKNYCAGPSDIDSMDGSPPVWKEVNKPLLKKIVDTLDGRNNVIYELMNEPEPKTSWGDEGFLLAVADELHALLNAPGKTGSKVISFNGPYASLKNSSKVDLLSVHLADGTSLSTAGSFGGSKKPVIISNDGEKSQTALKNGWSDTDRAAWTKKLMQAAFGDGSGVGHTHFEFLEKDLMGGSWLTQDYEPSADDMSAKILATMAPFAVTELCGEPPPKPPKATPQCPIGAKSQIDNDTAGKGPNYFETGGSWTTWTFQGQNIGSNYRYLTKYSGTKTSKGTAKWVPKLTVKGLYRVQAIFRATGNRTNAADFWVYPAKGAPQSYIVNQSQGLVGEASVGPVYADLGTHYFEPGKGYVLLDGNDGKSDEADAVLWTLKACTECQPNCAGKTNGAPDGCNGFCGNCTPACDGKAGGADDGCGGKCPGCVADCQGKAEGQDDGCGGKCPKPPCTPTCTGKTEGQDDGCGTPCPKPPDLCPSPGPGPNTMVRYAGAVSSPKGWDKESLAEDKDNGTFATCPNLDKGETLTGTSFGTCDPTGSDVIQSVKVAVKSKVQYQSGKYAVKLKLTVGTKTTTFSHEKLAWDELDVSSLHPEGWTWDQVKHLKATVGLHSHPGGFVDSDVWVDAFRVSVTYISCTPNVKKVCNAGSVTWQDGCGNLGSVLELCEDGNACTTDACDPGTLTCTHAKVTDPTCVPPKVCTPKASKECLGGTLLWLDSCGVVDGIADTCDDGDPCTLDLCDGGLAKCGHTPIVTGACKPCPPAASVGCLGVNLVSYDGCGNVDGLVQSCDDGLPCTTDGCAQGKCTHAKDTQSPACLDCTPKAATICASGGLTWVDACGNTGELFESCDDADPCTLDLCDAAATQCLHVYAPGPSCTAGCAPKAKKVCLGGDVLWLDGCGNPSAVVEACNDGNACTLDTCDTETLTCTHAASDAPQCKACPPHAGKTCFAGVLMWVDGCGNSTELAEVCNDGDPCTIDLCDPNTIACKHAPSGAIECKGCTGTGGLTCFAGLLVDADGCGNVLSLAESCDDGEGCTIDACDPATKACVHTPSDAPGCKTCVPEVEKACAGGAILWVDSCKNVGGIAGSCEDGDDCTLDVCLPAATGVTCAHHPVDSFDCKPCEKNASVTCVDGNVVSVDSCGAFGAVVETCDDADPCTTDGCDGAVNACYHLVATGAGCAACTLKVGKACFGGNVVWVNDCGGKVTLEIAEACADKDACTLDTCDPSTLACTHKSAQLPECDTCKPNASTRCEDGNVVWVDSCNTSTGVAVPCDDGDPCTADGCDTATAACTHVAVADPSCTTEETCGSAPVKACVGKSIQWLDACGKPASVVESCLDANACTSDDCDPDSVSCYHTTLDIADCGGTPGPGGDCGGPTTLVCQGTELRWLDGCGKPAGLAAACDDGDECTVDTCDAKTVACIHVKSTAKECNDVVGPGADAGGDVSAGAEVSESPTAELAPTSDAGATSEPGKAELSVTAEATLAKDDVGDFVTTSSGSDGCAPGQRGSLGAVLVLLACLLVRARRVALLSVAAIAFFAPLPADAVGTCGSLPGPTMTKYASSCAVSIDNGWNWEDRAEGADNDIHSECPGLDDGDSLSCTGFGVCDPPGNDLITSVKVGVRAKVASSQLTAKLAVAGKTKTFSNTSYAWIEIDVSSTQASWTWDEVNKLTAKVLYDSGLKSAFGYVDAFRVVVGVTTCAPNVGKVCAGNTAHWIDACGFDLGLAENCDDGNPCTVDGCGGSGQCYHNPVPNTSTTCMNGHVHFVDSCGNVGGMLQSCDDGNGCTVDGCANSVCSHQPTANAAKACHNGNLHWTDSCGGIGALLEGCDDGNGCTADSCSTAGCLHAKVTTPACCQPYVGWFCDGNKLYQKDSCSNLSPMVEDCNDGTPCTIDACDPGLGVCTHAPDTVACPPCVDPQPKCLDNAVAIIDSCNNVISIQESCDDGNPCTIDTCDAASKACGHTPSTAPQCHCKDGTKTVCQGNALVEVDLCDNPTGKKTACDDVDPCTFDLCDPVKLECSHTPNDGPPCKCTHVGKVCKDNKLFWMDDCGNASEVADDCDDKKVCTIDGCDAVTKACNHVESNDPKCKCQPGGAACNGNVVVAVDTCGSQTAVLESCDDQDDCTLDLCEPQTATCAHEAVKSPLCCAPANASTSCQANTLVTLDGCKNVTATTTCDDADACTIDVCDAAAGVCLHTKSDSPACCQNKEAKTQCFGAVLMYFDECGHPSHLAEDCDDQNPCTTDTCDESAAQCVHVHEGPLEVKQVCKDSQLVWVDDCEIPTGLAQDCDDKDPCTVDGCDAALKTCTHVKSADPQCCVPKVAEGCVGTDLVWLDSCGKPGEVIMSCLDGKPCTTDSCAGGQCVHAPATKADCMTCGLPALGACVNGNAIVVQSDCATGGTGTFVCGDDPTGCTKGTCDTLSNSCTLETLVGKPGCPTAEAACPKPGYVACFKGHVVAFDGCDRPLSVATSCNDGNPCTTDGCSAGKCLFLPLVGADGCEDPCGGPKKALCDGLTRVWTDSCGNPTGATESCDDADGCTTDSCDAVAGCQHAAIPECSGGSDAGTSGGSAGDAVDRPAPDGGTAELGSESVTGAETASATDVGGKGGDGGASVNADVIAGADGGVPSIREVVETSGCAPGPSRGAVPWSLVLAVGALVGGWLRRRIWQAQKSAMSSAMRPAP